MTAPAALVTAGARQNIRIPYAIVHGTISAKTPTRSTTTTGITRPNALEPFKIAIYPARSTSLKTIVIARMLNSRCKMQGSSTLHVRRP